MSGHADKAHQGGRNGNHASRGERGESGGGGGSGGGPKKERLQRVMADAGIAARRVCEAMIESGRVKVNGAIVRSLPVFVTADDDIEVDGRPVPPRARPLYVMVHKPERTLVTASDEPGAGRTTVMDLVKHPSGARLFPVGRMDYYSTGLLLLTNDGDLANRLTHPRYGVPRTYEIAVRGTVTAEHVRAIKAKLRVARERASEERGGKGGMGAKRRKAAAGDDWLELDAAPDLGDRSVLRLTLRESGTADLRDVLQEIGIPVKRMSRVSFGPLKLTGLSIGRWRELERAEVQALRRGGDAEPGHQGRKEPRQFPTKRSEPRRDTAERGPEEGWQTGDRPARVTKDALRASGFTARSGGGGGGGENSRPSPKKIQEETGIAPFGSLGGGAGGGKMGRRIPQSRADGQRKAEEARMQKAQRAKSDGFDSAGGGGGSGSGAKPRRIEWNGSSGGGKPG